VSAYRSTAQEIKVFWFFSSEKNILSSFSEEKEAKRLLFLRGLIDTGLGRMGACGTKIAKPAPCRVGI
jgi:hypothetical protein